MGLQRMTVCRVIDTDFGKGVKQMSKLGGKNKDSKKAAEKKMQQQLAALQRKNAKKKK